MANDHSSFLPVLDESELQEGSMKPVKVEGTPILLTKVNGKIFAFDNRCPHMSCLLSGGTLDGYVIVCPCHEWRFDLRTGEYAEQKGFTLTKIAWKKKSGKIWIKLEV